MAKTTSKGARDALTILELDQARWGAVLDTSRDAIVSIDPAGIVTLFNRSAEEVFGYGAAEVLGQNVRMLMPPPYRDEHDGYLASYQSTRIAKAIGRIRYVEARRKSGEVFPIELSVSEAQVGDQVLYTAVVRDVTERKRIEEALARERDFAESLIETAEAVVLVRDTEGRIVLYNPYLERLSGFPLAETKGKNWFSTFLAPGHRQRSREIFVQAMVDGSAKGYVNSLVTRGGSIREIEWQTRVLRDSRGGSGVLSIGMDITERRRAERHLATQYAVARVLAEAESLEEASPRLLRAICESSEWDLGETWMVDPAARVLRLGACWHVPSVDAGAWSEARRDFAFAPGEGLPGRIWQSGRPILVPDVSQAEGVRRFPILEPLGMRFAFGLPLMSGQTVVGVMTFFDRATPKGDEDLLRVLEAVGRHVGDFIERKRAAEAIRYSERRFEAFMDNSPAIAFMKDEAGRLVYANRPFERQLHLSRESVYGKDDSEIWPRETAQQIHAHDLRVLADDRPCEVLEHVPTPAGAREWFVYKFPMTDAAGQRLLAAIAVDVTDRRRAEERMLDLQRLAQERERLADIGAITAKIAHDLGNPLSGLSMLAQLVLQRARRDPAQPLSTIVKPAEQLVSEVRRLDGMIREFLTFAREQRLDLRQIDLRAFLREVVALWLPLATSRDILLTLDDSAAPEEIQADESKLRRVLDNLVKNAIEAIPAGFGAVRIVVTPIGTDKARISVEDTGGGIPDTLQVFRLFETTKANGSGLGLAVSKQIVLAHGGDLSFTPREPHGTAFHVELPLQRLPR